MKKTYVDEVNKIRKLEEKLYELENQLEYKKATNVNVFWKKIEKINEEIITKKSKKF